MSEASRSADKLLGLEGKGLTACRMYLERLRQEQAEGGHSKAQERILAISMKKVEARIGRLEADTVEADRLEEEERLRREDHARRFPVERGVYAPMLSETKPTTPVDTSLIGREREVADAWHCLALLRAKGGGVGRGVGRRVGIAIRNIVGAAGNRHNAGDVVLFCDWEPSEMELGMAEGTCWVRPEGWDRILVDTPLPPEAIEERIKRRRRLYTHNMVYGVSGSSVIEVGAVRSAESAVSASRSAEAIPNSVSEVRWAARVAQGVQVAEQVTQLEAMIVRFQAVQESLEESRHQAEAVSEAIRNVAADSQAAAAALQHQMDRVSGDMAALRDTQAQAARMASKWHSRVLAEIEEAKAILSEHLEAP